MSIDHCNSNSFGEIKQCSFYNINGVKYTFNIFFGGNIYIIYDGNIHYPTTLINNLSCVLPYQKHVGILHCPQLIASSLDTCFINVQLDL